ncbi:DoxX family protein [Tannerella forsythia]|uniref:DoxX family protein n=1 Tax=Tannerella forsythia TaxID=28112 RepID=A0A3P1XPM9_TANFO|nr:DoxX family protein [Tannerella forsythia]RRD60774.1 DoxX family protein [Tannerella forsythia]RRD72957.1 DoxX family protein [Tannerella forsythia]
MKLLNKNVDAGLLVLRLSLGILMLLHGLAKLTHGAEGIGQMLSAAGWPSWIAYGVYIGEIVAPILIILGYATRMAASVFLFNMVVAVAMVHAGDIFALGNTGGWAIELQGLYLFGALTLMFTGAGKYALSQKNWWD